MILMHTEVSTMLRRNTMVRMHTKVSDMFLKGSVLAINLPAKKK